MSASYLARTTGCYRFLSAEFENGQTKNSGPHAMHGDRNSVRGISKGSRPGGRFSFGRTIALAKLLELAHQVLQKFLLLRLGMGQVLQALYILQQGVQA